jgi:endonuclease YncB( thermonuclease family)
MPYGRLCGTLTIGGSDVGAILIDEGLAERYVCGASSWPAAPELVSLLI